MARAARIHRPGGQPAEPGKTASNWRSDARRGTRQERGYDNLWLKLRAAKLAADPLCEDCLKQGRTQEAHEVHHIEAFEGLWDPLRLDWDNLASLCRPCHRAVTASRRTPRKPGSHPPG